ncbi:MAG: OmpH/Skp family outer membrane protein [Leptospirillum sp.]|jgi:outer membrane protein
MKLQKGSKLTGKMAVTVAAAFSLAGILSMATPAQAASDVAVVDVMKTFEETDLGKSIQTHVKRYSQSRANKLKGEQKALQDENNEIRQQSGVISKDALKAKEMEFQQHIDAYKKEARKLQTEMASETVVGLRKFIDAENAAAKSVAQKYGFSVVIGEHPIRMPIGPTPPIFRGPRFLYINKKNDLTESVIAKINKDHPAGGGN